MSGGVDSSVAAYLLKEQGYDVVGVFIMGYNVDGCAERDAEDARRVAGYLDIPFYVFDFGKEYKKKVVEYMIDGYRKGITPNPDVICNKEIKFGLFLEKAREMGADYIATGHYVRLRNTKKYEYTKTKAWSNSYIRNQFVFRSMYQAKDKNKDQSYFLWTLTQEQLKYCLFPIGEYTKPRVRGIARNAGLPTAEKKDSQGICFLGQVSIKDFLKEYIPTHEGAVVTADGMRVGTHEGAEFYTIGQRHGLNLGIKNKELGITGKMETKAHYVAEKDVKHNTIMVAEGDNNPLLEKKEVIITNVNFITATPHEDDLKRGVTVYARIRYRQPLVEATLIATDGKKTRADRYQHQSASSASISVKFSKPIKFVAPGQSAVFYSKKGRVLGGGVII